ncbi:PREDICTED: splicing factor U2af large subunit A isoform X2 [Nelumbo nucifera]|uniref:Splicing factor U2af large subunit A isoform X2 n=1 Tax=Nelumbo nucifera TaxID=4432 RepID=A0A1U8B9T4_NELNU|nr:PREDICTED: splicing factor U2af large subunit A isoform X2 [Nelumbo nucifera]
MQKMSRISHQKDKYGLDYELSRDNCNEGTAARTRPFSFEEIMLRRQNKKPTSDAKEGTGELGKLSVSGKDNVESTHSEAAGGYKWSKDAIAMNASEDTAKRISKNQEGNTPIKKSKLVKDKDDGSHDIENKLSARSNNNMGSRSKGDKNEKQSQLKSRSYDRMRDYFEDESEKRHSKNTTVKDKYSDRDRGKSERETKRKQRTGDDEKKRSDINGSDVKKYDSGKWHDSSEPSERKGRKESSQSRYDEGRQKRRRSRSREHDRDRDRRSHSLSPRSHKRSSYHGQEHGDSSFNSSKDRPRKQHSDADRHRTSNNGYPSSHHRRHGGSTSGLGGYSPRKRRTEAAAKTPSPTVRSPERKTVGWDLPPKDTDNASAGSLLVNFQSSNQTVTTNIELPNVVQATLNVARALSGVSPNTLSMTKTESIDSIQLTQATRPMRRLYVENVPASASDKAVIECVNGFLLSSGVNHIQGTHPCISCIINKEKGHAILEFLTAEDATAALSFDGRSFSGSILKIRRPKDFVEAATGVPQKPVATSADAISDIVNDSPHKIFIGGISRDLSSDMLMEIAGAFGHLKAFCIHVNEDLKEQIAFLEYVDKSITLKACAGLNGMKLGGQILTVVQAVPDASSEENTENPPSYEIPDHAKPLLDKPTQVLKLKNVFNQEELASLSGPELEETLEDIRLECARFGTVKSVNIVKDRSNYAFALGTSEVTSQNDSRDLLYPEDDDHIKEIPRMGDSLHLSSEDNSKPEHPNDAKEFSGGGGTAEENSTSVDMPVQDLAKDGSSEPGHPDKRAGLVELICHLNADGALQEPAVQLDATEGQLVHNKEDIDVLWAKESGMGTNLMVEEFRAEETNDKKDVSIELDATATQIESGVTDKGDKKQEASDLSYIFEPGCILVEYARTEASCMAAHCLHRRPFGNRNVEVGYVAHDLYLAMFPK